MRDELRTGRAFCRICLGHCGMVLTMDGKDRIVDIRGDREHPLTRGYACFKGLQAEEAHHGPTRLLHPLRKNDRGMFDQVGSEQALDEIAAKIGQLINRHGPASVAVYVGNGSIFNTPVLPMQASFLEAIGSRSRFTSYTIDQSAKTLSFERLGGWAGGTLQIDQCDVVILIGTNPLLSHGVIGLLSSDPTKRLKEARARGLKLIVIDPRHSETAGFADLAVQPLPGNDPAILAGLIRLILDEHWEDQIFCGKYVGAAGMQRLRKAVEPFGEDYVEAQSGLRPGDLRKIAELFARDSMQGPVLTGTGPSMAPHSNLMQHLADCLNVICGRFTRVGDRVLAVDMLTPPAEFRAEVIGPSRQSWKAPASRILGVGSLAGEKTTGTLPDEILTPGPGQIRCLITFGGNLASLMPDQKKMLRALTALDLNIVIDPFMTNTARLADYVIPPLMQYERADLPVSALGLSFFPESWTAYSPPLLKPPIGSDVIEEWYFFWAIAKRLGKSLDFCGVTLDRDTPPTIDELLSIRCRNPLAPLDEIKRHPAGRIYSEAQTIVQPPRPEATATFDVMPDDVEEEMIQVARDLTKSPGIASESKFTHLLSPRRMRDFFNSTGMYLPNTRQRNPFNPAYINPNDLAELGAKDGDRIIIASAHGSIEAIAQSDPALRPGVVSMAVGWGGLPGEDLDPSLHGASTNMLLSIEHEVEPLNAMPWMSAVPVSIAMAGNDHGAKPARCD